jgi:hypothetical protein
MAQQPPGYYVNPRPEYTDEGNPWILRIILLGSTGVMLLVFSLVALVAGYQFMAQDQIYPGISPIYGSDISGMTLQEAINALSEQADFGDQALFTFQYGEQRWEFSGTELGVDFDVEATVNAAFNAGRGGNFVQNIVDQWDMWRNGYPVAPVITYTRTESESRLATLGDSYINQPVLDATLTLTNSQVTTTPSQTGLQLDVATTMALLEQEILALNTRSVIPLQVGEARPTQVSTEAAAEKVRLALDSRGVTFLIPAEDGADAGPWVAPPASIEKKLRH